MNRDDLIELMDKMNRDDLIDMIRSIRNPQGASPVPGAETYMKQIEAPADDKTLHCVNADLDNHLETLSSLQKFIVRLLPCVDISAAVA